MVYLVDDKEYTLSYSKLKSIYDQICGLEDKEFLKQLPKAAHLASMICFLKEIPTEHCLGDTGIIHELIHLMDEGTTTPLKEIRSLFENQLKLE